MSGRLPRGAIACVLAACLAACGGDDDKVAPPAAPPPPPASGLAPLTGGSIEVTSRSFESGAAIPTRFAHPPEGTGAPPDVSWGALPAQTKEVVLLVDDPDAGEPAFVHWLVYGMDPKSAPLAGGKRGKNDFGELGWGGPQPPKSSGVHHYRFRVFALDTTLTVPDGSTWADLLPALKGHVLAEGRLVATYERR